MSFSNEDMAAYKALPYRDKWNVNRCLMRGEAPSDPAKAVAAVELAERYQRRSGPETSWLPVLTATLALGFGALAIANAIQDDALMAIFYALIVVGHIGQFMLNPMMRPKQTTRALEASRRSAGMGVTGLEPVTSALSRRRSPN